MRLTATLLDANGNPLPNTPITFGVATGPNARLFAAIVSTDQTGTAITPIRGSAVGVDDVQAWVDSTINGNVGSVDPDELVARTSITWTLPPISAGPVLMIHGVDAIAPYGNDCAVTWDDAKQYLRANGFGNRELLTVRYYEDDVNCDKSINDDVNPGLGDTYFDGTGAHVGSAGHTGEAAIEHLGYHLAWFIYNNYSSNNKKVDLLTHSMGGLIARYAVAEVENKNASFPKRLLVGNVVTFGTPHGGARKLKRGLCQVPSGLGIRECSEMKIGSPFLTELTTNAWDPEGEGGTDWTAIGSDDDNSVAADSAVGTNPKRDQDFYFGACHKVWYPATRPDLSGSSKKKKPKPLKQGIEHDAYMHKGTITKGMDATDLLTYSSGSHCGAPLGELTGQRHPMGLAALALASADL